MVTTTHTIAKVLSKAMATKDLADLINLLLNIGEDGRYTDDECAAGDALFNKLCDLRPEAVDIAMAAAAAVDEQSRDGNTIIGDLVGLHDYHGNTIFIYRDRNRDEETTHGCWFDIDGTGCGEFYGDPDTARREAERSIDLDLARTTRVTQ